MAAQYGSRQGQAQQISSDKRILCKNYGEKDINETQIWRSTDIKMCGQRDFDFVIESSENA